MTHVYRNVALAAALLAGPVLAQDPPVAPGLPSAAPPSVSEQVKKSFIDRLEEFASDLSDTPARTREFRDAVAQFRTMQAEKLMVSAKLSPKPGKLTDDQIQILNEIIDLYRDTDVARIAEDRLSDHALLLQEPTFQDRIVKLKLPRIDAELTEEQLAALDRFIADYEEMVEKIGTNIDRNRYGDSYRTAERYLQVHRRRLQDRALKQLISEFLQTPGAREALEEFAQRRLDYAMTLVESQRGEKLENLIQNFPDTQAAAKAKPLLEEIHVRIEQAKGYAAFREAQSAVIREYWDHRYPPRTWTFGPKSNTVKPTMLYGKPTLGH